MKNSPSDKKDYTENTFVAPQHPIEENTSVRKPKPTNKIQQLKELKEMLDNGILTEEEFNIEKTKILSAD